MLLLLDLVSNSAAFRVCWSEYYWAETCKR